MKPTSSPPVQSVDRALTLLRVICAEREGISLTALSARVRLPVQTVQGLVRTLEHHGMVEQVRDRGPYRSGPGLQSLLRSGHDRRLWGDLAFPCLRDLVGRCDESVLLAELSGHSVIGVAFLQADQPLSVDSRDETFLHLHTMATGKVLLAGLSRTRRLHFLRQLPLPSRTPRTVTDAAQLASQLERVADQGWAETVDEAVVGVSALAVPVYDDTGTVVASLGMCLPSVRYESSRRPGMLAALQESAGAISRCWFG